jgi:hypothetical protein
VQLPDAMHLPPVSLPFPFHLLLACSCHFSLPRARRHMHGFCELAASSTDHAN